MCVGSCDGAERIGLAHVLPAHCMLVSVAEHRDTIRQAIASIGGIGGTTERGFGTAVVEVLAWVRDACGAGADPLPCWQHFRRVATHAWQCMCCCLLTRAPTWARARWSAYLISAPLVRSRLVIGQEPHVFAAACRCHSQRQDACNPCNDG